MDVGPACRNSLPTGFSEWGLSHISHAWNGSPQFVNRDDEVSWALVFSWKTYSQLKGAVTETKRNKMKYTYLKEEKNMQKKGRNFMYSRDFLLGTFISLWQSLRSLLPLHSVNIGFGLELGMVAYFCTLLLLPWATGMHTAHLRFPLHIWVTKCKHVEQRCNLPTECTELKFIRVTTDELSLCSVNKTQFFVFLHEYDLGVVCYCSQSDKSSRVHPL